MMISFLEFHTRRRGVSSISGFLLVWPLFNGSNHRGVMCWSLHTRFAARDKNFALKCPEKDVAISSILLPRVARLCVVDASVQTRRLCKHPRMDRTKAGGRSAVNRPQRNYSSSVSMAVKSAMLIVGITTNASAGSPAKSSSSSSSSHGWDCSQPRTASRMTL